MSTDSQESPALARSLAQTVPQRHVAMRTVIWARASALLALTLFPVSARADDASPPPGYHVEHTATSRVIVPGVVITGVGGLVLALGLGMRASAKGQYPEDQANASLKASIVTTIGLIDLAVGVPLLTVGLLSPRTVYVPNHIASLAFAPIVSKDRAGGALTLSF